MQILFDILNLTAIVLVQNPVVYSSHFLNELFIPLHDLINILLQALPIRFATHRALLILVDNVHIHAFGAVGMRAGEHLLWFCIQADNAQFALG